MLPCLNMFYKIESIKRRDTYAMLFYLRLYTCIYVVYYMRVYMRNKNINMYSKTYIFW